MVYAAVRLEELWDEVGNWVVMDSWRWWFKRDGWPLAKKHGGGGPPQESRLTCPACGSRTVTVVF